MRYLVIDDDRRAYLTSRLDDQPVHGLDAGGLAKAIPTSLEGGHLADMAILAAPPALQVLAVRGLANWCGWILDALGGTSVPVALSLRDHAGFSVSLHRGANLAGVGAIIALPPGDLARYVHDPAALLDRIACTLTLSLPDRLAYAFHDPSLAPAFAMLAATSAILRSGAPIFPRARCWTRDIHIPRSQTRPSAVRRLVVIDGASPGSPDIRKVLNAEARRGGERGCALAVVDAGEMTDLIDPGLWSDIYPIPSTATDAIHDTALAKLFANFEAVTDLSRPDPHLSQRAGQVVASPLISGANTCGERSALSLNFTS